MSAPIWSKPDDFLAPQSSFSALAEIWSIPANQFSVFWEKLGRGEGVKVGIGDTGVRHDHPDLMISPSQIRDFTRSASGGSDRDGHGTHTTGTVVGKNRIGVASGATPYHAKVLGDNGFGSSKDILDGCKWLEDQGCEIISLSLGASSPYNPMCDWIKGFVGRGGLLLAAAGNSGYSGRGDTTIWPARCGDAIMVASYDRNFNISNFSSGGREVDIAGPGSQITSANAFFDRPGQGLYAISSGTSMSTPHVAGVVAVCLGAAKARGDGSVTAANVWRDTFARTTDDRGADGKDVRFGLGSFNYEKLANEFTDDAIT